MLNAFLAVQRIASCCPRFMSGVFNQATKFDGPFVSAKRLSMPASKSHRQNIEAGSLVRGWSLLVLCGLIGLMPACRGEQNEQKVPPESTGSAGDLEKKPLPPKVAPAKPVPKAKARVAKQKQRLNEVPQEKLEPPKDPLFRRLLGSQTGVNFENALTEDETQNILTYSYMYNGGGVAVGDINNDGLPDLFFTSNQGSNALYLNLGEMRFKDISEASGIAKSQGWHAGANMVDVNGDGWLDIYVCRSGPGDDPSLRENLLFMNGGNLQFEEQAAAKGVADSNHSTQASFFDYDRDGDLDLYVMNHPVFFGSATVRDVQEMVQTPEVAEACSDNLYENDGTGSFTRITSLKGLRNLGYGLGLITADLNGDGWTDIYVANDFSTPDFMYINQKNGTFVNEIKLRTQHISYFGMGCDQVDINRDAKPDLVVMDMTANDRVRSKTLMPSMSSSRFWGLVKVLKYHFQYMFNTLQLNQGDGHYSDMGLLAGIAKTDWSWAVLGADFDHDGWDDLLVTNGFRRDSKDNDFLTRFRAAKSAAGGRAGMAEKKLMMQWVEQIPSQRLRNYLFQNNGDLTFKDQSLAWGFHEGSFSNGASYADLDADGDLDLVINNIDDPAFIYENLADEKFPTRTFVRVTPVDEQGSPVLNAKVKVSAGGISQQKELTTCRGYQSSVAPVLHFGLGQVEEVASIVVYWPDGTVTSWEELQAGKTHVLKKTDSAMPPRSITTRERSSMFQPAEDLLPWRHQENLHNEYELETLLPHSQSTLGPCVSVSDVNGDGTDDLFLGAAHGFAPELWLQTSEGRFLNGGPQDWQVSLGSENVDAVFFDADGDGDDDLYVANGGGSEFKADDLRLCDQLFLNEGGQFALADSALPKIAVSSGTVVPIDFDADGDWDLFIGGHVVPGKYPFPPKSYFLENDGGTFQEREMPAVGDLGMLNDAIATDFNGDGQTDLVCVGEWTAPQFLQNKSGEFFRVSFPGTQDLKGWWFDVTEMDVNADGRPDYLLGNLGKNNKFKSKGDAQLKVLCNDFDENGSFDIVLAADIDGRDFPVRGKECSTEQMPFLKSKFESFHEFALADLNDMFDEDELDSALQLEVNTFASCVLLREGDGFTKIDLPNLAQLSLIRDALPMDLNDDGVLDLVTVGNLFDVEVETTRYDAGMGLVLLGNGDGTFNALPSGESGFRVKKDSRQMAIVETATGKKLVVVNNNDQPSFFNIR